MLIVTILANLSFRVVPMIGESIANIKRGKGRIMQPIKDCQSALKICKILGGIKKKIKIQGCERLKTVQ